MMRTILLMLLLAGFLGNAQSLDFPTETKKDTVLLKPDPRYREDQFYAGISYTLVQSLSLIHI